MIVEDEYLVAMELAQILEDSGYIVVGPAATVAAALALLKTTSPSACVLDVNLRGEVSAPVAWALKERNVPFILSSGYKQETIDSEAAFDGVANIGKPAQPDHLVSALADLLGR
ncbi:response regulator [Kaistia terrae]|uniref:Response regulator n=1 Tax=Kaistia terrae TaxID=537017 RepID=A0ABW0PY03_9HYPH|nr:response regulator [Kaistia terrae]MCX5581750.1 response regulator [Kaistia terrae]